MRGTSCSPLASPRRARVRFCPTGIYPNCIAGTSSLGSSDGARAVSLLRVYSLWGAVSLPGSPYQPVLGADCPAVRDVRPGVRHPAPAEEQRLGLEPLREM